MGLVANTLVVSTIVCTAIYAVTRILALLIVLRGTRPQQRAELVLAVAELFRFSLGTGKQDSPGGTGPEVRQPPLGLPQGPGGEQPRQP